MSNAIGGITRTLFGGGSSSQQSTQSSQLDPRLFDLYNQNVQRATGVADQLQARQFADFTPDFYAGRDQIMSTIGGPGQRSVEAAQASAARGLDFSPQSVSVRNVEAAGYNPATASAQGYSAAQGSAALANRGDIRDVAAQSFLNANIGDYMNPYLNLVAGNTIADMDRARQMTQMQNADAAAAARAFGGSRQGVLEAETNRGFFDRLGNTLGGLYASGFDTASGLAMSDFDRALAANLANQGMDLNITGLNVGNQQAMALANVAAQNEAARARAEAQNLASLANAAAQNEAARFGASSRNAAELANQQAALAAAMANQQAGLAGNQQRLAATGLLGDLGSLGQDMTLQRGGAVTNLGLAQQQLSQAQLDAIRNLPLEQQAIINESLGISPAGGSGVISTGQSSGSSVQNRGIFGQLFPGGI